MHRPETACCTFRSDGGAGAATEAEPIAGRWNLLEERRLDSDAPRQARLPAHERLLGQHHRSGCHADVDAGKARLGYHDHYVVDGGKRRIILAALVTPADVMENQPMLDLLWRVRFRRKLHPRQATGDTTYGTVENIVALEDAGIRAYVPLPDMNHRRPFYGQDEFAYDAAHDAYHCPAGHALARERIKHTEGVIVYRADAATCNACPLKAECTESNRGRIVHRSLYADYLDKVRGYHATEAYKKAMRKRQVWVEPLVRRGQALAWLTPLPAARARERQYRGVADRGWSEPEALAGRNGMGTASCPVRKPSGPPTGVRAGRRRLQVTIPSPENRIIRSVDFDLVRLRSLA